MEITFDTRGNAKQLNCCEAWIDDSITDIVYGGSKGSAKSYTGVSLIFGDALTYPGTHYFIARKKLNDLRKFTIPSIHEVFTHWGLSEEYFRYNGVDNYFELYNKSRVYLIEAKYMPTDPQYMRLGSMQMTRGWIEEAGEFDSDAKANLHASIGRWKNKDYNLVGKLLQTCNPSKNYLYRDYYKPHRDRTLPHYRCFIQALPVDNKMLPDGYLENLNRILSTNEKERLLKGNWEYDDDPATLIDIDSCSDYFENTHVTEEGLSYMTVDVARLGKDKTVARVWKGFRVVERQSLAKSTIPQTVELITQLRNKYGIPISRVVADEDGVGGGVVDIAKCKGFVNNSRAIKGNKDYKGDNYDNLKSQCSFIMADLIVAKKVYEICRDDAVKQATIEEFEQVKKANLDVDGKQKIVAKDKVKDNIGRSPDEWDSIMMRAYFILKKPTTRRIGW